MAGKRKILFIVNPISGIGKKNLIPNAIDSYLDHQQFDYDIKYTEYPSHGHSIAKEKSEQYDAIVAIGGDGTVNEIGSGLVHSNCALGIIPSGSGNGVARHLGIPQKMKDAIQRINQFNIKQIDTGICNDIPFIGVCGFGFDAHIAEAFEKHHKRGFRSYIKLISRAYRKYIPAEFTVSFNNEHTIKKRHLLVCIANSSQYGNGFAISPESSMSDGRFEVVFIKKFPVFKAPRLISQFFNKQIHLSKYFYSETFTSNLNIEALDTTSFHVDGDLKKSDSKKFEITIHPKSLHVLV